MQMFSGTVDRSDGYLRIETDSAKPTRELVPNYPLHNGLLFVDIDGPVDPDAVGGALQYSAIPTVKYVVFRWPVDEDADVAGWLEEMVRRRFVSFLEVPYLGVLKHHIGAPPQIVWATTPHDMSVTEALRRAMRSEFRALLEWGHAIWTPTTYHYELPSGDHTNTFIRVGEIFRNVRDVEVVGTWFYERLVDNVAIVAESASLVPLLTELRRVMQKGSLRLRGTVTLDEYPRTIYELRQAVEGLDVRSKTLAIMSVNASGRYRDMILGALEASQYPADFVTMIDKMATAADCSLEALNMGQTTVESFRWIGISTGQRSGPVDSGCQWCQDSTAAQLVRIDPKSFHALALPEQNLVMPDKSAAMDLAAFFTHCSELDAIEYEAPSESPHRLKGSVSMPIKLSLSTLIGDEGFRMSVLDRITRGRARVSRAIGSNDLAGIMPSDLEGTVSPRDQVLVGPYDCIVVNSRDMSYEGFPALIKELADELKIEAGIVHIDVRKEDASIAEGNDNLGKRPIVVSLGSMSGWTLRQILVTIAEQWKIDDVRHAVPSALVVHSTSRTTREFDNTVQSFSGRLFAVWGMYLPSRWPLRDEIEHLTDMGGPSDADNDDATGGGPADALIASRTAVAQNRESGRSVFLGPLAEVRVRNESLYGRNLGTVATLVAVGAAIHSMRQRARNTDPRWPSFDFVSISRSYYDGVLVAAMLRWCQPNEVYWGATPYEQTKHINDLMDRMTAEEDRRVLLPELLLAALQGKIPTAAVSHVAFTAVSSCATWPDSERLEINSLVELLRDAEFDIGSALG